MNPIARVRPIEAIPIEVEGQPMVLLRDPYRFAPDSLTVSMPVYLLMCLIDGGRSPAQLRSEFRRQFGAEIGESDIADLAAQLDGYGLLETERFAALRQKALTEFDDSQTRPAAYAGAAYAESAQGLRDQIDRFYDTVDLSASPNGAGKALRGLVAPHIDPRIGGPCAARAFHALRDCGAAPDLFVVLGTAHQYTESLFVMTEKAFETPLGNVEVDLDVSRALTNAVF